MPAAHWNITRPAARLLIMGLLLGATGGCAMTFNARSLGVTASMSAAAGQPIVGDTFNVTLRTMHLFWGLYPARVPKLQSALAGQLAGGGGIANLSIRYRRRWSDVLVTALTVGLVNPSTVTFGGIVTRTTP